MTVMVCIILALLTKTVGSSYVVMSVEKVYRLYRNAAGASH